ncbi:fibroblast growth factor receptor 3-like [Pieris brassicae]|uniref:fibroblast growth factor receptor 3-like n=1 Tax=Pieris brassicae TaxID=7116 RepID=UPI001E65F816|nr:fibroblast growth factor receptor 3-like [Pieris brassicae]
MFTILTISVILCCVFVQINLTNELNTIPSDVYPVSHAALPRGLAIYPLPLENSDHEVLLNVTWDQPMGPRVSTYSLEVDSIRNTVDCQSTLCYEYNIPGDALWALVPSEPSTIAGGCAVRPGCSYRVKLIAHPWDGHTSANVNVQLDECILGVCSCAHSPRLPRPEVDAELFSKMGDLFVNVSWSLPAPQEPLRLPPRLRKQFYYVSLGKQMISDAHPSPWFSNTITRSRESTGFVAVPEGPLWMVLPINERSVGRSDKQTRKLVLDVKMIARVSLVDERGCIGPAGNHTAYDPSQAIGKRSSITTYILWALLGGVCVLAMLLLLACTKRVIKRVLRQFYPATAPSSLEPMNSYPIWFLRQNNANVTRGQMEESPLYDHKEFEPGEECDDWEVSRSRVHLGALIGSGAFGRVHAAHLDMPGGETITVAAKMLTDSTAGEEIHDFLREIAMLKHVGSHKHVIRLVACCTRRPPLIALLEHAPRGDLLTLLRAARGKRNIMKEVDVSSSNGRPSEAETEYTNISDSDPPLDPPGYSKLYIDSDQETSKHQYVAEPALHLDSSTMRDYALQVALGMQHLEARGITHRDLAARNILVDGAGVLKVADFGLSRSGIYVHTRSRPVPLRWLAPEAIFSSQYSSATDVWAFAVLLWEIATFGGFPYAELSNQELPEFLTRGGRLSKPARASLRLYQLMEECWSNDPSFRPTFAQIVNRLTVQNQLYVDLDCVFPPFEDLKTE